LHVLKAHGADFLSAEESKRVWNGTWLSITALGKNLVLGRDKKFWSYHRAQLRQAGVGFQPDSCVAGSFDRTG